MTIAPKIDVRDLESVRSAARTPEIELGDDWVNPKPVGENKTRKRRAVLSLFRSAIARKIVTFNLFAMMLLIAGVLYIDASRDTLAFQRAIGLSHEAELVADVFEAQLPVSAPVNLITGDGVDVSETLSGIDLYGGAVVSVYDAQGNFVATNRKLGREGAISGLDNLEGSTPISNALAGFGDFVTRFTGIGAAVEQTADERAAIQTEAIRTSGDGRNHIHTLSNEGKTVLLATSPIMRGSQIVGIAAVESRAGELDNL